MYTNATAGELAEALAIINEKFYQNNLSFRELVSQGNKRKFTLKAVSGKLGSRLSSSGRKGPYASWHAHGSFFDQLFKINPNAWVRAQGRKITKDAGNWQEISVGSFFNPAYMSDRTV